jgi:uncharacterized protein YheU (UPF0270 family)
MADLFNATNSNAVTNFVLVNGANYNKINATLDPRVFQVGSGSTSDGVSVMW